LIGPLVSLNMKVVNSDGERLTPFVGRRYSAEENNTATDVVGCLGNAMKTITKKDLVDRIAEQSGSKRVVVKRIIQQFLEEIIHELGDGNRLEFRDFGVFEVRARAARIAQNPKTMEKVQVPSKRTVKFKIGRLMKDRLFGIEPGSRPRAPTPSASSDPVSVSGSGQTS
jgi:integration host factor subunit beta